MSALPRCHGSICVRYGCYTDDIQMLLALAASLVNRQCCNAADTAQQYAKAFDERRGYGGSAVKVWWADAETLQTPWG
jgi:ADP-ribosylglycohydrolase